jgi:hypothetical protein
MINEIKQLVNEIVEKDEFKNTELSEIKGYKENLINLCVYEIAQSEYFENRYDFVRLHKDDEHIFLKTLEANELPLLTNNTGYITSDFANEEYNGFFGFLSDDEVKLAHKDSDVKTLDIFYNNIRESNNFFDLVDKIKEIDNKNDDFIIDLKRLMKEHYNDKTLLKLVTHFLDEKEGKELKKKMIVYDRNKTVDMFVLRDCFSMDVYNTIRNSIKDLDKHIINSDNPIISLNNFLNNNQQKEIPIERKKKLDETLFFYKNIVKKELKKINKLIDNGHPGLKNSLYGIYKETNKQEPYVRVKTLIDRKLYSYLKKETILNLEEKIQKIPLEKELKHDYQHNIDSVVKIIKENYPELNIKASNHENFSNYVVDMNECPSDVQEGFTQSWLFSDRWNQNESLKGIGFMSEEYLHNNYGSKKDIITIHNNIENVGYITICQKNNTIKVNSITPAVEIINNVDFIRCCDQAINDYMKKNNKDVLILSDHLMPHSSADLIEDEKKQLYLKGVDAYIVGEPYACIDRYARPKNIMTKELTSMFEISSINLAEIDLNKKVVNNLKKLEKKYEIYTDENLSFDKKMTLYKEIRSDIESALTNKKEKRLKNVY